MEVVRLMRHLVQILGHRLANRDDPQDEVVLRQSEPDHPRGSKADEVSSACGFTATLDLEPQPHESLQGHDVPTSRGAADDCDPEQAGQVPRVNDLTHLPVGAESRTPLRYWYLLRVMTAPGISSRTSRASNRFLHSEKKSAIFKSISEIFGNSIEADVTRCLSPSQEILP